MKTNQNKNRKTESKNGSENGRTQTVICSITISFVYQPVGRALTRSSLDY